MVETMRERDGAREVLVVNGDLTVEAAGRLKEAVQQLLETGADMVVRIGTAGSVDISFPQLLCSAHRAAADRGLALEIAGAEKEPLASLLRAAGFLRHIGCRDNTRRSCLWTETSAPCGEGGGQ
jgi:ABC-type transporter Mla MlaB component